MNSKTARKLSKRYNRGVQRAFYAIKKLPLRYRLAWAWAVIVKAEMVYTR